MKEVEFMIEYCLTLRNYVIGDKKFEFLAFSLHQLWKDSVWMFTSREGGDKCSRRVDG